MKSFLQAHVMHPEPMFALAAAAAQIEAQSALPDAVTDPTIGWLYITPKFAPRAEELLADLNQRWPGVAWVGATGMGVLGGDAEYFDEPAVSLMLGDIPREDFRVFSGRAPLRGFDAWTAQVNIEWHSSDDNDLVPEMASRTEGGSVFGNLSVGPNRMPHIADGVLDQGLSGVAFSRRVALRSCMSHSCRPIGPVRRITEYDGHLILSLDGRPALDCLKRDMGVEGIVLGLPYDGPYVAIAEDGDEMLAAPGRLGVDSGSRFVARIDEARNGFATLDRPRLGRQLVVCDVDMPEARRDWVRACTALVDDLAEPPEACIAGAVYAGSFARADHGHGEPHHDLAGVRQALGDVPVVGTFGGALLGTGLKGMAGVLTVFLK